MILVYSPNSLKLYVTLENSSFKCKLSSNSFTTQTIIKDIGNRVGWLFSFNYHVRSTLAVPSKAVLYRWNGIIRQKVVHISLCTFEKFVLMSFLKSFSVKKGYHDVWKANNMVADSTLERCWKGCGTKG